MWKREHPHYECDKCETNYWHTNSFGWVLTIFALLIGGDRGIAAAILAAGFWVNLAFGEWHRGEK